MMRFKDRLRELRKAKGLTQEGLANESGVPLTSIRGHEQGHRIPSWHSVVKLSRGLGVPTDMFSDCDEVSDDTPKKKPRRAKR
jgi:transcriptional regulator with XRE-family HTH domain